MRRIAWRVALAAILTSAPSPLAAQARRALLVGINDYDAGSSATTPPEANGPVVAENAIGSSRGSWRNLKGSVNDVLAMQDVLVRRFGFERGNLTLLTDRAATRDGLLRAIKRVLVDDSVRGDVVLFFYAGHGSQVLNSLSLETDKLDETLVPSDSRRGAPDIPDQELKRLLNQAIDKGVLLTVILDSCHSGSATRGYLPVPLQSRSLAPVLADVKIPPEPMKAPSEGGALVLVAAQDSQSADEEADEGGTHHGVFTVALTRVLQSVSPDEPAERIFLRVRALMQASGTVQEPVLEAGPERRREPLFGGEASGENRGLVVAVSAARGPARIELQAGRAAGLTPGCVLRRLGDDKSATPVKIRVTAVGGPARSTARVKSGSVSEIQPGQLFELIERAPRAVPDLLVLLPPATLTDRQIEDVAEALAPLQSSPRLDWVDDPTTRTPTHLVAFDGSQWRLSGGLAPRPLGASPSAVAVEAALAGSPRRPALFVSLPPSAGLVEHLGLGRGQAAGVGVARGAAAVYQYALVGRIQNGVRQYAWIHPGVGEGDRSTLPIRTDWVDVAGPEDQNRRRAGDGSARLASLAGRLAKVRVWLELSVQGDSGRFPYRLVLRNTATEERLSTHADGTRGASEAVMHVGDPIGALLVASPDAVKNPRVERRFVYLFSIDSYGKATLLFPRREAGGDNRLPPLPQEGVNYAAEVPLAGGATLFRAGLPLGIDHHLVLATEEALPDPWVLESPAVRDEGATRGGGEAVETTLAGSSGLLRLLKREGRGAAPDAAPSSWSLSELAVRCQE